jgi:hypothetical protein
VDAGSEHRTGCHHHRGVDRSGVVMAGDSVDRAIDSHGYGACRRTVGDALGRSAGGRTPEVFALVLAQGPLNAQANSHRSKISGEDHSPLGVLVGHSVAHHPPGEGFDERLHGCGDAVGDGPRETGGNRLLRSGAG